MKAMIPNALSHARERCAQPDDLERSGEGDRGDQGRPARAPEPTGDTSDDERGAERGDRLAGGHRPAGHHESEEKAGSRTDAPGNRHSRDPVVPEVNSGRGSHR
jgi:hypothetical protein